MNTIDFTLCIPTYNSEKTLQCTLNSIQNQKFDRNKIEVLIIDGGSTDKTLEIANTYNFVKIIKNEKRLPEFAKLIGINNARGKYFTIIDSDESFAHNNVLNERLMAFQQFPSAHLLVADKLNYVKGFGVSGHYLNICGDPFTWFIYKNKHGVLNTFTKNISKQYTENNIKINLLTFKDGEKRPIADGGTTTYDLNFLKQNYSNQMTNIEFVTAMSDNILNKSNNCLCIKGDDIFHRSKSQLRTYLKKIRFRIVNNVFMPTESGFSSRTVSKTNKKFLFPLYTLSFVLPLFDSIKMSIEYKNISMMLHIFYTYYTTTLIMLYMLLKIFGIKKQNKEY